MLLIDLCRLSIYNNNAYLQYNKKLKIFHEKVSKLLKIWNIRTTKKILVQ